jgi:uncharacterized protein YndB with AHSA1/START domain
MAERTEAPATEESVLVVERVFDAPRELVWKAWTEPEAVMRWWGPKGFTSPACQIDLRVGGRYLWCMRSREGQEYWSTGVYRELVQPERLVCTNSFADAEGNPVPASHYGIPEDFPEETLTTLTFEELGGKTKLTLRTEGMPAGEAQANANTGWNQAFDKLAAYLAQA